MLVAAQPTLRTRVLLKLISGRPPLLEGVLLHQLVRLVAIVLVLELELLLLLLGFLKEVVIKHLRLELLIRLG